MLPYIISQVIGAIAGAGAGAGVVYIIASGQARFVYPLVAGKNK